MLSLTALLGLAALFALLLALAPPAPLFQAVMWQPDCASARRLSDYRGLGARVLFVQYLTLDATDFTAAQPCPIDLAALRRKTGASRLIVGLAGLGRPTLGDFPRAAERSRQLLRRSSLGLDNDGFYAPLELHPGVPAAVARTYLAALPRPLWVSVYAGSGGYDMRLVEYVRGAVPQNVGVIVQDGVGAGHATPAQAARVARALMAARGAARVSLIVECFRATGSGRFRMATPWEIERQLAAYGGIRRIAFDGGHYLPFLAVRALLAYHWLFPPPKTSGNVRNLAGRAGANARRGNPGEVFVGPDATGRKGRA